ncbi:MAG: C40 family peptidase [Aquificaceae bacterium]
MRGVVIASLLIVSFVFAGADNIVLTALTYMERPYKFGADHIYRMDCSAFVRRVFKVNGINLPRTTEEQAQVGVQVNLSELKPGDLLFFSTYRKGPSHVGIYIGNGKMVHASESMGITVSRIDEPYWRSRFLFARRVVETSTVAKKTKVERRVEAKAERDEIADLIFILSSR